MFVKIIQPSLLLIFLSYFLESIGVLGILILQLRT